jgi:5'-nucleotidase (lipoprotein e(P4) family)
MRRLAPAVLLLAACATTPAVPTNTIATSTTPPCRPSDATINATLWEQTAAEYVAITREVYGTAQRNLDAAIADPSWSALASPAPPAGAKPAVILDVDETVLDTSSNQGDQIKSGTGYNAERWHLFTLSGKEVPIEAARDFLNEADRRGVAVFYVTNRVANEEEALRKWLREHNYPVASDHDNLLMRSERPEWEPSDKTPRRNFVGSQYRVIMLFGDDLNDFVPANGVSLENRAGLVRNNAANWGRSWYMLPNPTYGSWERSLLGNTTGMSDCDQWEKKKTLVRTSATTTGELTDVLRAALLAAPKYTALVASPKLPADVRLAAAAIATVRDSTAVATRDAILPDGYVRIDNVSVTGDIANVTLWYGPIPQPARPPVVSLACGTGHHFTLERRNGAWSVVNRGVTMC